MAGNDREGRAARSPVLLKAVVAGVLVGVAGAVGWALFAEPPLTGQPYVIAAIPKAPAAAGGPAAEAARGGDAGKEKAPEPTAPAPRTAVAPAAAPSKAAAPEATPPKTAPPAAATPPAPQQSPHAGEVRLARAPIPALTEESPFGPLPRIAADGRAPATAYARARAAPAPGPGEPVRIALLVGGLGVSASDTSAAIGRLPATVSFGFSPYGSDLQTWVDRARGSGHEVMLHVPMEPFDYPDSDPGPHALMTGVAFEKNRKRLHWAMGRFSGYFGVTNSMGAKFTADRNALGPVLEEIAGRGLAYLDDGASPRSKALELAGPGPPVLRADVFISAGSGRAGIAEALARLEAVAKENGRAVGVALAAPLVIDLLDEWSKGLAERAIELVPVSAAAARRS